MKSNVVSVSKDVMGGTPVFRGTRVPIKNGDWWRGRLTILMSF